jgi:hypothetical protein
MREKTKFSIIPILNCLANYITNGWALSHMCVGKTKGPPQYFCLFYWFGAGGGGDAHGGWGRVRGHSQQFLRAFWRTTRDPTRGRGTQTDQPPPPRLQSPSKHSSRALLQHKIYFPWVSSPQHSFNACFGLATRDPTRGRGAQADLTPSPQAKITIETPITRALTHLLNPFFPFRSFSTGQNRRFFRPIRSCLYTVKNKYSKWLVSLLPSPKNRTSLSHIQPILEAFKVRKP